MTGQHTIDAVGTRPDATGRGWYFLGLLTVVTLYGAIDRRIFVLLADPIKAEMSLSDTQLGLLQGLGVSLFGIVITYPLGWLADRYDRRLVMAGCISAWSLAVVGCALANGYPQLFIASAMVGAGEAGLGPIAYALIPLFFYNNKRQLANSLYVACGLLGAGPAVALCGYLIELADWLRPSLPTAMAAMSTWRLTFLIAASPAPIFVALVLFLRLPANASPVRGARSALSSDAAPAGEIGIVAFVRANFRTWITFQLSVSIVVISVMAVVTWWPIAAMRQFKATPIEVGNMQGLAFTVSAAIAMLLNEAMQRFLKPRCDVLTPIIIVMVSFVGVGASLILSLAANSAAMLFTIFGFFSVFATSGSMAFPTALQEMGPAHLRGRITGLYSIFSFAGIAIGPLLVGVISDSVGGQQGGLIAATALVGTIAAAIGFGLLSLCLKSYRATYDAARALE